MSVVLFGVEKPKTKCKECYLYEYNCFDNEGICYPRLACVDPHSIENDCPMHQLPDEHGPLIDKYELLRRIEESGNYISPAIRAYIETAEVIVESE